MSGMLEWRHLVPTAPDTLIALPQTDDDPFIISKAPDVLFAGNQAAYGTRLCTGMLLCMLCMLCQMSRLRHAGFSNHGISNRLDACCHAAYAVPAVIIVPNKLLAHGSSNRWDACCPAACAMYAVPAVRSDACRPDVCALHVAVCVGSEWQQLYN